MRVYILMKDEPMQDRIELVTDKEYEVLEMVERLVEEENNRYNYYMEIWDIGNGYSETVDFEVTEMTIYKIKQNPRM